MRHVIEIQVVNRTDDGQLSSNYRTHVITLSNRAAVARVIERVKDGTSGWDEVLKKEDVLEYEERFDH